MYRNNLCNYSRECRLNYCSEAEVGDVFKEIADTNIQARPKQAAKLYLFSRTVLGYSCCRGKKFERGWAAV